MPRLEWLEIFYSRLCQKEPDEIIYSSDTNTNVWNSKASVLAYVAKITSFTYIE